MLSFLVNLLVALLWLFLSAGHTLASFLVGFFLGFALLWLFQGVLPADGYIRRTLGFARFAMVFAREFLVSNLQIARAAVLTPPARIHAGFLTVQTGDLSRLELLLLTHCITLTPGTTSVEVAEDGRSLVVHAFYAEDPGALQRSIQETFVRGILEFTR